MTVMGPPVVHIMPGTNPGDICSECGLPQDDPLHAAPPKGNGGEGPTEAPTGFDDDDEPKTAPKPGEDGDSEDDGEGGDEPTDDDADEDGDDETDGPDGDDGGDDDETDESGNGNGGDEPTDEPTEKPPVKLPDEMRVGAGRGAPVPVTDLDRAALQKAVDEDALLEGDPTYGRGQILRDPTYIEGFVRRPWGTTAALGAATSAIRGAFMRSKTGVEDYENGQRRGRLGRDLYRVAIKGEQRLFGQRRQPGVNRYNLWVLVDCSASMAGREIQEASSVAQAFAAATATMGTIRTSVWGWTDAFASQMSLQANPDFGAVRVYTRGDDPSACRDLCSVPMGGTPDHSTMAWAIEAIRRDCTPGEVPIIVFVSDGMGYAGAMKDIVAKGRKQGTTIIGVNISSGTPHVGPVNDAVYGSDYIPWLGGIAKIAGPLARLITKVITPR